MTNFIRRKYYRVRRTRWSRKMNTMVKTMVPRGVVMLELLNNDGDIRFGWALCDKHDTFSYKTANMIAVGRLRSSNVINVTNPEALYDIIDNLPRNLQSEAAQLFEWTNERIIKLKTMAKTK